jgi:hypothetical protein
MNNAIHYLSTYQIFTFKLHKLILSPDNYLQK